MGCICFENPEMGIYFITDPDGYWIEIIPTRDFCSGVPLFRKERRGDLAAVRDCKETPCGWP